MLAAEVVGAMGGNPPCACCGQAAILPHVKVDLPHAQRPHTAPDASCCAPSPSAFRPLRVACGLHHLDVCPEIQRGPIEVVAVAHGAHTARRHGAIGPYCTVHARHRITPPPLLLHARMACGSAGTASSAKVLPSCGRRLFG